MTVVVTHTTPADGSFSAAGAAAWDADHALSGLGTMAEQDANNVAITGGTISGVTLPAAGSDTQVQYNSAGAFAGMSGTSWDDTNRSLTVAGATVTASKPIVNLSQTWNNSSVAFTGALINVTNTASATNSMLMDLQLGGVSKFKISKAGEVIIPTAAYYGDVSGTAFRLSGTGVVVGVNGSAIIALANNNIQVPDVILSRKAAANLRFGAANAAAPIAQTLSVQSVVAGTTNTAGTDFTITGSQGTGTGAGGNIVFQVAPAGTTGSAQNALADALTIKSNKQVAFQLGSAAAPSISSSAATSGIFFSNAGFDLALSYAGSQYATFSLAQIRVGSSAAFGFSSGVSSSAAMDTFLTRRAAANVRLGAADAAAPIAQTLSVQSVVAGTTNTAGANLTITGSQGTGTGDGGSIIFQVAPAGASGTAQNALADAMSIDSAKTVRLGTGYTVATLPAAGIAGRRTYVTDAVLPTYLGALTGGGSVICPVFDDGTQWVSA